VSKVKKVSKDTILTCAQPAQSTARTHERASFRS